MYVCINRRFPTAMLNNHMVRTNHGPAAPGPPSALVLAPKGSQEEGTYPDNNVCIYIYTYITIPYI